MKSYIEGLTDCMNTLDEYIEGAEKPKESKAMRTGLEDLAGQGWITWETAVAEIRPDDNFNDTVVETPKWEGNELVIHAHGENALFVEFGTGVRHNYPTKYGKSFGFYPASWSTGPNGAGWLGGERRRIFKGKWILPKGVTPEDMKGMVDAGTPYTVTRRWMTKKYGLRERTYTYQRKVPIFWAEGHKPANGMYKALKVMRSKETSKRVFWWFGLK